MSLLKLIFTFATEASPTNPKFTVLRVKSLQFVKDGPSFMFPPESQDIVEHEELMKTSVAKSVKKVNWSDSREISYGKNFVDLRLIFIVRGRGW